MELAPAMWVMVPECLRTGVPISRSPSCQIRGSNGLEIKCTINIMWIIEIMAHLVCGKIVFYESSPWCQKCCRLLRKEWRVDCIKYFFPFGICRHWWLCGDDYNDQSCPHMEPVWTCQFRHGHMPTVPRSISFLPSLVKPETPQAGFPARKYELHICHSTIITSSLALKGLSSEESTNRISICLEGSKL